MSQLKTKYTLAMSEGFSEEEISEKVELIIASYYSDFKFNYHFYVCKEEGEIPEDILETYEDHESDKQIFGENFILNIYFYRDPVNEGEKKTIETELNILIEKIREELQPKDLY